MIMAKDKDTIKLELLVKSIKEVDPATLYQRPMDDKGDARWYNRLGSWFSYMRQQLGDMKKKYVTRTPPADASQSDK